MSKKEEEQIFKGYLRLYKRSLIDLKDALDSNDINTARQIVDHLITDAQKSIED